MVGKKINSKYNDREEYSCLCRVARKNFHFMQGVKTKFPFMQVSREKYSFYAGWQGKIFILCRMARKNIYFMQNRKHIDFQVGCQGRILMLTLGGQEK